MAILIDGFNLIYKFPDLEELMLRDKLSEARRGLLDKLKQFVKIKDVRIRVVFDGKKEELLETRSERSGDIDVYYSLDFSADFLIKEFIKKDLNPKMTTVVTSDKDIVAFVTKFKAKVKASEAFADQINKAIDEWIDEQTPDKEDNPILNRDELQYWENVFKKK